jgi:hypothetical protein
METTHTIVVVALGLFLVEGCALSFFPTQVQAWLTEADPRSLQVAGLVETLVALGLMAAVLFG